jgi:RimJ/RimL family protein N-acetyltransferase
MISAPEQIPTERLILRKPREEDAQALFESYTSDPEVTRFLLWQAHSSVDETLQFLKEGEAKWASGEAYRWALELREDDSLLGMIVARMEKSSVDVGYVLSKKAWGQGYMAEALKAVIDWALSQEEIFRVWAVCDTENVASARVMEKAGMLREGLMRRYFIHPNTGPDPRDAYMYAKVK